VYPSRIDQIPIEFPGIVLDQVEAVFGVVTGIVRS
jgi:hypothetical protein